MPLIPDLGKVAGDLELHVASALSGLRRALERTGDPHSTVAA
jgi:hypothetical protein